MENCKVLTGIEQLRNINRVIIIEVNQKSNNRMYGGQSPLGRSFLVLARGPAFGWRKERTEHKGMHIFGATEHEKSAVHTLLTSMITSMPLSKLTLRILAVPVTHSLITYLTIIL